jgi:hypothetical protein
MATDEPTPIRPDAKPNDAASNSAGGPRKPRQIDAVEAKLEGVEAILNSAFHASGAALLLSLAAMALAVFLLFRVRGLSAVKASR